LLLTAEGELERVAHIARQTLGYYKDTGAPTEVHIHDLLENVLAVYASKMIASGIKVDRRYADSQAIMVSKGEMLQVFSNVVANANDAMPEGGVLAISTREVSSAFGDGIEILIRDSGVGIEKDNLARIFEPFFTTKGNLGTGIGLWVTKQLLEQRGSQIRISSRVGPTNSGTTVTIFIPFARPEVRSEATQLV